MLYARRDMDSERPDGSPANNGHYAESGAVRNPFRTLGVLGPIDHKAFLSPDSQAGPNPYPQPLTPAVPYR